MKMTRMQGIGTWLSLVLMSALLAGCPSSAQEKSRGETLDQYETIIRWSQWDGAADFIAPEYMAEHPITRLQMDRLRLFRVTAYTVRSVAVFDEGQALEQTVEIRMFNSHQAVERTILDQQEWRYDEKTKRWWLYSGLPDPTQKY